MRAEEPHPQFQAFLGELEEAPAIRELPVEEVRGIVGGAFASENPVPVANVIDETIDGPGGDLALRIYIPDDVSPPYGVSMFFHGGGFASGGLDSHDQLARALAANAGVAVVAVDYRLAPENPFPAAVEDALAATEWVAENAQSFEGDADRLAVAGDSAGGNLAAVVAQQVSDDIELQYQVLAYPVTSFDRDWPSADENAEGYFIEKPDMAWFEDHYFENESDKDDVRASPILANSFAGLPDASIVTGGFDPFRDEGIAYRDKLAEAGVNVNHYHYEDAIHAFLQMATDPFGFETSQAALDEIADDLHEALS